MNKTLGLYVHIPFCRSKCAYCDFYSLPSAAAAAQAAYVDALEATARKMEPLAAGETITSVYLGGGTPSVLEPELFCRVMAMTRRFQVAPSAEITAEANPTPLPPTRMAIWHEAGINRVSIGMQSAVEAELRAVGRRHTLADVEAAVRSARSAGIRNISLDLMLGLPGQTSASVRASLDAALSLEPEHLSLYCLKLEDNTPLARQVESGRVCLPEDDQTADCYLECCERLRAAGLAQYEISNFAQPGRESRHNLRYWQRGEYLGIGAAAHSFLNGVRRFFPADLQMFQRQAHVPTLGWVEDEPVNPAEETLMLSLRTTAGCCMAELSRLAGEASAAAVGQALEQLIPTGLAVRTADGYALTPPGMLVSNSILSDLFLRMEPSDEATANKRSIL